MISVEDVRAAEERIKGRVRRTPLLEAGPSTFFKLEYAQHAGSFKTRGMFNQILAAGPIPPAGVVVASGGNAGLAAAYAAGRLGVPAEVFVPETAPPVKVAKLGKLGARVTQVGAEYAEAAAASAVHAEQTGALFLHAYDDPGMVAGNGTLGLELLDDLGFDTVLVAVGGGGLAAGVAAALADRPVNVVGVEPENCPTLRGALDAGAPVDVPVGGVAADSLGARRIGLLPYQIMVLTGMASLLVDDPAIVEARRRLWDDYRIVVEHGTAAAYAALTSGAYRPADGERVVVLLCGANTNPGDLA
ncbi:serine/threonine dehydratase [Actinoplanes sp. NBRC 103695]|uniref:serine/threonine dehydratase n=1 Tax=Actinoplanes sp. NBRC 103695 TaxID=3032202 RepID=UPI0024A3C220|nr:serine/threonine dehydratase [Actinoplanes sp. NBRC 103695]GLY94159.1 threonine dehydratase [Actinoplanes sp. NBRC 103695]